MNILKTESISKINYHISVVNSLRQYWRTNKRFSCIGKPKAVNLFLYLDGCDADYIDKNGKTVHAKSGDIVYTPTDCEYTVEFSCFSSDSSNTVGVNFFLYDDKNTPFILNDEITVFPGDGSYKLLFSKVNSASARALTDYAVMKAGMYEIMSLICEKSREKRFDRFRIISNGILYMENESGENLSIAEIAALCNVSEVYFRRLFKEYSGLSPSDYRLRNKIRRAKLLLKYENMTVSEIAESLSFNGSAYFIKTFRRMTGMTPLKYRASCL